MACSCLARRASRAAAISPDCPGVSRAFRLNPNVPHPTNQGYYNLKGAAPDGERYELTVAPPANDGLVIEAFMHMFPGGEWRFDHTTVGPGITLAEGIAYHVYDVELPSGRILPSLGEHEHGEPAPSSRLTGGLARLALAHAWEQLALAAPRTA